MMTIHSRHRAGRALALSLMLVPALAAAQTRVHRNVATGPVVRVPVTIRPGTAASFTTSGSDAGLDPVLRLIRTDGTQVGFDDNSGGGREARLTYAVPSPRGRGGGRLVTNYILIVHAASGAGQTTLQRDGATLRTGPIGGVTLPVPTGDQVVETAFVPGGASDPVLIGLGRDGRAVTLDDHGGVGLGARLQRRRDLTAVVVGAATPGLVDVLVNDVGDDGDGDGLGKQLERELGTCDSRDAPPCHPVANLADTDRDGLTDAAEVFGIDHGSAPLLLPRWGANPRHKDVFIEVDFPPTETAQSMTSDSFARVQELYAAGPAADLANPDGRPGVALHFDTGFEPVDPARRTLHGNWGGSGAARSGNYLVAADDPDSFAPHRRGVFQYALVSNGPGGGQGTAGRVGAGNDPMALAHELGHSFGLQHWGHARWGAINCKPNYDSIMNYAFGASGFSLGRNTVPLSPARAGEYDLLFADDPGTVPSYIEASPFGFSQFQNLIDWNRDGLYGNEFLSGDGQVRADLTWATWVDCAARIQNAATLATGGLAVDTTPRLVRLGQRLYALYVRDDGVLMYRHGAVSGPDAAGSCPGGDELGASCTTWSAPSVLTTAAPVSGFAAVEFGGELAIAYHTADQIRLLWAARPGPDGALRSLSAEETLAPRRVHHDVELAIVPLHDGAATASKHLALFYTDQAYQWMTSRGRGQPWTERGTIALASGRVMAGILGLSVVGWPVRGVEGEPVPTTACMAAAGLAATTPVVPWALLPPYSEPLRFLCLDPATARWTERAGFFPSMQWTASRPGLAFHVFRDAAGAPISTPPRGQFVLTFGVRNGDNVAGYVAVSTPTTGTATLPSGLAMLGFGNLRDVWSFAPAGGGAAPYEDSQLSALKAIRAFRVDGPWILEFLPLFDGTFDAALSDGNDFQVMERGICLSLRDATFCGGPNSWGY